MRKSLFLSRAACMFLAVGIVTAALAQGSIRIVSPKPNEVVRGEIEARFEKPFPDQGYTIIHLDGELKEASALNRYIIKTRDLPDGDHHLLIDVRDGSGKRIGTQSVTFRVANGTEETTSEGVRLLHWDLSQLIPTKRLLRYHIWAESQGAAVGISPPQAQGGPGTMGPGMMGGPGMMPGMMGPSADEFRGRRMGTRRSQYQRPGSGAMGMPGMMGGGSMDPGMMGGMGPGGPGMGGGGAGNEGAVDASALDKQMSLLVRSQIREVVRTVLDGKIGDAANIRMVIASALERTRQSPQQGFGGQAGGTGPAMMSGLASGRVTTYRSPYQRRMPGMGMGGPGGMMGPGGGMMGPGTTSGGGNAGVKAPWSPVWYTNPALSNLTFTKTIFPTGDEVRATGRLGLMKPYGKPPTAPLVDLLPRFPAEPVKPGATWTTPMVFIPELIEQSPVEVHTATMLFSSFEDVDGINCAKLEAQIQLPDPLADQVARMIGSNVSSTGGIGGAMGGGGPMGGMMGPMGSAMGGAMMERRMAPPSAELSTFSSQYQGALGSFGPVSGMMGTLAGRGMPSFGGAMGAARGVGGGMGMGGMMGSPGMMGMGSMGMMGGAGMMGPGGMSGGLGMGGGQQNRGENLQLANVRSTIRRVIYFDHKNKSVYRLEDIAHTEFDILGGTGAGGGGIGGMMGGLGSMMQGMGGMTGGGPAVTRRSGGDGGSEEGAAQPRPEQQQRTHVVYEVRIVAWQDKDPVSPTWVHNLRSAPNAHDYDGVSEPTDRALSSLDPKRPEDRVFTAEDLGIVKKKKSVKSPPRRRR